MSDDLDRRAFIGTTAGVVSVAGISANTPALALGARGTFHCIVVENGTLNDDGYSVSMLCCKEVMKHIRALQKFRLDVHYFRRNFRFYSTDRRKIPYFEKAIEYFSASEDLHGYTICVDRFTNWHAQSKDVRREIYFSIYRRLFDLVPRELRSAASVHLWARSTDDRDLRLKAMLQENLGPNSGVSLGGTGYLELMRFAGVVFGTIGYEYSLKGKFKDASKTKVKIREAICRALKESTLSRDALVRSGKFGAKNVVY
jgi:hypothetical protein